MNVITFTGNLGKDCRVNKVGQNTVVNFAVAMTEGYGENKKTHWVQCAYWGKPAESVAQYLVKGQSVCVSGEAGLKEASGEFPAAMSCRVNSLSLIGKRDADKPAGNKPQAKAPEPQRGGGNDFDDVPFAGRTSNYSF